MNLDPLRWFMRNKLTALTLLITMSFAHLPQGLAARKARIHAKSVAEQMDRINRFQTDCLTLIKSPAEVFQVVEVGPKSPSGSYPVRVRGKSLTDIAVSFDSDEISYRRKNGTMAALNFALKSSSLLNAETSEFSFVMPVGAEETATTRILVKSDVDQIYLLNIGLDARGQVRLAELDPVLDFSTKTKLCPKSTLRLEGGLTGLALAQKLTSMNGELNYDAVATPTLGLTYQRSTNPKVEQIFSFTTSSFKLKTAQTFGEDTNLRTYRAGVMIQKRETTWVRQFGESAFHPLYRYGLNLRNAPLARIDLADRLEIETPIAVEPSVGVGFNHFSAKAFMLNGYVDLRYPYVFGGTATGNLGFAAGASYSLAITRSITIGTRLQFQKDSFKYSRSEGLDRSGTADLSTLELELSMGVLF